MRNFISSNSFSLLFSAVLRIAVPTKRCYPLSTKRKGETNVQVIFTKAIPNGSDHIHRAALSDVYRHSGKTAATAVFEIAGVETGVSDIRHQIIEERKERKQNMRDPNIHHG